MDRVFAPIRLTSGLPFSAKRLSARRPALVTLAQHRGASLASNAHVRARGSQSCRLLSSCHAVLPASMRRSSLSRSILREGCRRLISSGFRKRKSGVARSGARRAAERAVRVPDAQNHRQLGPGRSAQGIGALRSADRLGDPGRDGPNSGRPLMRHEFAGELALSGALRPIRGALRGAFGKARRPRIRAAGASAAEAALVRSSDRIPAESCSPCARMWPGASCYADRAATDAITRTASPSPISPTCAANRTPSARWTSPRQAGIAS